MNKFEIALYELNNAISEHWSKVNEKEIEKAFNTLKELVGKTIPKKGEIKRRIGLGLFNNVIVKYYICPNCGNEFAEGNHNYCFNCGQALDWSEEDD